MTIAQLFHSLEAPTGNSSLLTAVRIPHAPSCRIARDGSGYPVMLFALTSEGPGLKGRSYRLRYLELMHHVPCTIREAGAESVHSFTLVRFTSVIPHMQAYFLQYAESFVRIAEDNPSAEQFDDALHSLVKIFSSVDQPPAKSVQGLWAELFVIDNGRDAKTLLDFWHARPEEKFDFNAGNEKIEVKSSLSLERVHYFSSDQLNPAAGSRALIASVPVRPYSDGVSIGELIGSISSKVDGDFALISKLNFLAIKVLGSDLEEAIGKKFDYKNAKESMQLYLTDDIPKISVGDIPKGVTEVRFRSSLQPVRPIAVDSLAGKGRLLSAL